MISVSADFCTFSSKRLAIISETNFVIIFAHMYISAVFWRQSRKYFPLVFGKNIYIHISYFDQELSHFMSWYRMQCTTKKIFHK
jgi:hypothetical protein